MLMMLKSCKKVDAKRKAVMYSKAAPITTKASESGKKWLGWVRDENPEQFKIS